MIQLLKKKILMDLQITKIWQKHEERTLENAASELEEVKELRIEKAGG